MLTIQWVFLPLSGELNEKKSKWVKFAKFWTATLSFENTSNDFVETKLFLTETLTVRFVKLNYLFIS